MTTTTETPWTDSRRTILGLPQPGERANTEGQNRTWTGEVGLIEVDGRLIEVFASRSDGIAVIECPEIGFRARGKSIDEGTTESNRDYVRHLIRGHLTDGPR